jgi:hypothetical protein
MAAHVALPKVATVVDVDRVAAVAARVAIAARLWVNHSAYCTPL